ncbi:MAG: hypothetical protein ABIG66_02505 [Candidatus Kerfeldbacteria bacterium]
MIPSLSKGSHEKCEKGGKMTREFTVNMEDQNSIGHAFVVMLIHRYLRYPEQLRVQIQRIDDKNVVVHIRAHPVDKAMLDEWKRTNSSQLIALSTMLALHAHQNVLPIYSIRDHNSPLPGDTASRKSIA